MSGDNEGSVESQPPEAVSPEMPMASKYERHEQETSSPQDSLDASNPEEEKNDCLDPSTPPIPSTELTCRVNDPEPEEDNCKKESKNQAPEINDSDKRGAGESLVSVAKNNYQAVVAKSFISQELPAQERLVEKPNEPSVILNSKVRSSYNSSQEVMP
mmetsp:Transcript_19483/g.29944  ORF Transcript_19483/g.29944 Transcript_19483/m.29944 type:complete len:158 (+) Transcript_19483:362-835(+)|eukprot:CAMPEP_0170504572 /NCGR_PEP_ID=MMETSP0208-20121228/48301_1 /TAXON_ID=197538 /ORGANISM="Strombidium inclinatum, Strain S3" /LENGTH=157 /DNA_ID=CAMNT_0010784901 /DNA_START=341 /DNA_END=814 /DNA_ORIENTATION=-